MLVLQAMAACFLLVMIGAVALGCEKTDRRYNARKTDKVSHKTRTLGYAYLNGQKPDFPVTTGEYSDAVEEGGYFGERGAA